MTQSRCAEVGNVVARHHVVQESQRSWGMSPVFTIRPPTRDRRLGTSAELPVRLMHRAPCLACAAHFQIKKLAQVMAQSSDERRILPARAVSRATEAIDTTVGPPLHNDVALE